MFCYFVWAMFDWPLSQYSEGSTHQDLTYQTKPSQIYSFWMKENEVPLKLFQWETFSPNSYRIFWTTSLGAFQKGSVQEMPNVRQKIIQNDNHCKRTFTVFNIKKPQPNFNISNSALNSRKCPNKEVQAESCE